MVNGAFELFAIECFTPSSFLDDYKLAQLHPFKSREPPATSGTQAAAADRSVVI
jgi:hypothetical protein